MVAVGDQLPAATLMEVPYTPELDDPKACAGPPQKIQTQEAFKGKKVVIVSIPGAFTPTCHGNHIPAFIQQANKFAEKGYEVYVISANDPFVLSGFRTSQGAKGEVHFATDLELGLSKALNATVDLSKMGFGLRSARYALVADDLTIKYFEVSFLCLPSGI